MYCNHSDFYVFQIGKCKMITYIAAKSLTKKKMDATQCILFLTKSNHTLLLTVTAALNNHHINLLSLFAYSKFLNNQVR